MNRQTLTLGALLLAGAIAYILGIRGQHPFGTNEAYSAWAAAQPGVGAIIAIPVLQDPGKQLFYYIVLHYFGQPWGYSESAVRALSLLFALGALALVYVLARDLFDAGVGVAATAIWVFNPLAIFFAYQARGYSMFLCVGLAQMVAQWRLRAAPTAGRTALCGILSAALLYTHMAGMLILGSALTMLVRDYLHGRRTPQVWVAMGIAALLFAPDIPIALAQSHELVAGHWLDWVGAPNYSLVDKVAAGGIAGAAGILLVCGPAIESRRDEPLRWLAAWSLMPILALAAGSIVVRPMFSLRYVVPSFAALAVLAAGGLTAWSVKLASLAAAGFALACVLLIPFAYPSVEPWPQLAATIATADAPRQPIFFESGFTARGAAGAVANGGFPAGYYAVPFNYYFHGPNPRMTIPGYDPAAARATIAAAAAAAGGAWLVSWKDQDVAAELPDAPRFRVSRIVDKPPLAVYRILPGPVAAR